MCLTIGSNFCRIVPTRQSCLHFEALPTLHAYTGCDYVSSFATRGKKTAWDTWKTYEEATPTFLSPSVGPAIVSDQDIAVLEILTILLYNRISTLVSIDECRKHLFTKKRNGCNSSYKSSTGASILRGMRIRVNIAGARCFN